MMPLKKQEVFALILNRMQNGAKIHMGPFRELNYETATDVSHSKAVRHAFFFINFQLYSFS